MVIIQTVHEIDCNICAIPKSTYHLLFSASNMTTCKVLTAIIIKPKNIKTDTK